MELTQEQVAQERTAFYAAGECREIAGQIVMAILGSEYAKARGLATKLKERADDLYYDIPDQPAIIPPTAADTRTSRKEQV